MRLAEQQRAFWDVVRSRSEPGEPVDEVFTASHRQSARERMLVYRRAYWQRQLSVLGDVFGRCATLLGTPELERLLIEYIEHAPSNEPCIERAASGFVQFLSTTAQVSPRIVDLACLEWALLHALLASNAPRVVTTPGLEGRAFVEGRLTFVPSLRFDRVARAAWELMGEGREASAPDHPEVVYVATWRPSFAVRQLLVQQDEARAFELALSGATLGETCTAFAHLLPAAAAQRARSVLGAWFTRGWVSACEAASA